MKKLLILLLIGILFTSCADNKVIDGKEYRPYGLINESSHKNDSIHYEVAIDATICGVVFFELIVPPIYIFGYNLYEPICKQKDFINNKDRGVVN